MERPGIHPRWISQNNLKKKYKQIYTAEQTAELHSLLEYCGNNEDRDEILRRTAPGGIKAPDDQWWTWVSGTCRSYGYHMLDQFQARTLETNQWSHEHASGLADAFELDAVFTLRNRMLDYQRGKSFFIRGFEDTPYAILFLLIEGETDRALQLANAAVSATQWGEYKPVAAKFTSNFMLGVLADFLGRKFNPIKTQRLSKTAFDPESYFQKPLASWRSTNLAEIEELLLAICDCHTQLAWSGAKFEEREFTHFWTRIPLAALLILKLRELEGLSNPVLQHPLMESALGTVPLPNYVKSSAISTLRERADKEGLCIAETISFYRIDAPPPRSVG